MYLTDEQLAARFVVSRITVWRWAREGRLPKPLRIGPNCTRWDLAEVEAVEARLRAERDQPERDRGSAT